jgi:phospholipase C
MKKLSEKIEHIIVLMLENRSFDSMLGNLYPKSPAFNGLFGNETNPCHGQTDICVWSDENLDQNAMSIPNPDPGELWNDINMQLFGLDGKPGIQLPPMNGFVNNYVKQNAQPPENYIPQAIMHYYSPTQVPVLSQLAKQFAVSDQWFASAPCQTWPNRFFLHTGTANGYENNSPTHFPYLMDTIFNHLQSAKKSWIIYFHDFPQTLTLSKLWSYPDHFHFIDKFKEDAKKGNLPAYSFIEPRYFPGLALPNDQHPPHHVGLGEQLIAEIYNAVRSAPTWEKTLLIITYDEHGGCYDHEPPPLAVTPNNTPTMPFNFDRYGVRVPAIVVSPYIKPGTILRIADDGELPHQGPPYPFDHTSILASIRKCFNLEIPLSNRDAVAPDLEQVLMLEQPNNHGPLSIIPLPYKARPADLQAANMAQLNDLQKALHEAAAHLPDLSIMTTIEGRAEILREHLRKLASGSLPEVPPHRTTGEALSFINSRRQKFLGK